jgi:hypothetical protein
MIRFELDLYNSMHDKEDLYLQGIVTIICPNCLSANFIFGADRDYSCYSCTSSLYIAHDIIRSGIESRVGYHERHWPKNDIVMTEQYNDYLESKDT